MTSLLSHHPKYHYFDDDGGDLENSFEETSPKMLWLLPCLELSFLTFVSSTTKNQGVNMYLKKIKQEIGREKGVYKIEREREQEIKGIRGWDFEGNICLVVVIIRRGENLWEKGRDYIRGVQTLDYNSTYTGCNCAWESCTKPWVGPELSAPGNHWGCILSHITLSGFNITHAEDGAWCTPIHTINWWWVNVGSWSWLLRKRKKGVRVSFKFLKKRVFFFFSWEKRSGKNAIAEENAGSLFDSLWGVL